MDICESFNKWWNRISITFFITTNKTCNRKLYIYCSRTFVTSSLRNTTILPLYINSTFKWLKYCRYSVYIHTHMSMHKKHDLKLAKVINISSYTFPFCWSASLHDSTQSDGKLYVEPVPGLGASSMHQTSSNISILRKTHGYTLKKRI